MKNIGKLFIVFLMGVSFTLLAFAEDLANTIEIESGYVRGLPPTVKNTSAYMTIMNRSDETLELIGAKSEIAASIMIHRTQQEGTMMAMHHMKSLSIPAHGKSVLEPGGAHLMIMGLKAPVSEGSEVNLILLFNNGAEYPVSLPVRSVLSE